MKSWVFNIRSYTQILKPEVWYTRKIDRFQFSANFFLSNFLHYSLFLYKPQKPGFCNLFLSYCFFMLSSIRRFSNPAFQNLCSNPYVWGVKTRVSNSGSKLILKTGNWRSWISGLSILISPLYCLTELLLILLNKLPCLDPSIDINDEETNINMLFDLALDRLAFLPFGYLVDKYRWDLMSGKVSNDDMNCHWHKLR